MFLIVYYVQLCTRSAKKIIKLINLSMKFEVNIYSFMISTQTSSADKEV